MDSMLNCEDVQKILKVPQSTAYAAIRAVNGELKEQGYLTLRGKCPAKLLYNRFGIEWEPDACEK
ncbi:transcriptional regulator [Oscillospiraceae bacterium HV4-5-C5C]|nr:transcriptional regulator [Oscillospiraceae bacterium HV4-5-C5C]